MKYPSAVNLMLSALPYETAALAGYTAFVAYNEKENSLRIPALLLSAWGTLTALRIKCNGWGIIASLCAGISLAYIQQQKSQ